MRNTSLLMAIVAVVLLASVAHASERSAPSPDRAMRQKAIVAASKLAQEDRTQRVYVVETNGANYFASYYANGESATYELNGLNHIPAWLPGRGVSVLTVSVNGENVSCRIYASNGTLLKSANGGLQASCTITGQ